MSEDKSSSKRVPALLIDFSQPIDYNIVYPLTPASKSNSITQRAKDAGKLGSLWNAEAIRMVDAQHGIYQDIPIVCKGKKCTDDEVCEYAQFCPFDEDKVDDQYKGGNCPVEVVEAFKLFAGYVVDLEIKPTDFTDLQTIVDLIRLQLLIRRCDLYQKDKPIWEKKVGGIHQKTGTVHFDKVPNLGYDMTGRLRADLDKKYQQLVATRLDKMKADSLSGQQMKDMATYIKSLTDAAAKVKKDRLKKVDTIDAEFKAED